MHIHSQVRDQSTWVLLNRYDEDFSELLRYRDSTFFLTLQLDLQCPLFLHDDSKTARRSIGVTICWVGQSRRYVLLERFHGELCREIAPEGAAHEHGLRG